MSLARLRHLAPARQSCAWRTCASSARGPPPSSPRPPPPSSPFDALGVDLTPAALGRESDARATIDALGPSSFTISGVRVSGPVVVMPRFSTLWNVASVSRLLPDAFALVKLTHPRPDIVLLGTGEVLVPASPLVRAFFKDIGVSLEVLDTKNACHTFNVLNQESRSVSAALFPMGHRDPPPST